MRAVAAASYRTRVVVAKYHLYVCRISAASKIIAGIVIPAPASDCNKAARRHACGQCGDVVSASSTTRTPGRPGESVRNDSDDIACNVRLARRRGGG